MAGDTWNGDFTPSKKLPKRQVKKIKPIYDEFVKRLSEFDKTELSGFLGAIYDSYVARIEVESEIEALNIFERTNARGLDLEISDLLKNHLFARKVDSIEEFWQNIVSNSHGTLLRMLKYFYVSRKGYVQKPQLYKKLKSYAVDIGPQRFTKELAHFSEFYAVVKTPSKLAIKDFFEESEFFEISSDQYRYEKINRALEALREFGVVQFCPPAYAAAECLRKNEGKSKPGDAKKLIQLFEAFEKYHFINNVICERVGNEVEKLYADICKSYSESSSFVQTTDSLINQLKAKLAREEEFVANFINLTYSPDQTSLLHYIFDRFNNFGLDPGQCIQIYNPDPKLRRRNHNIEHFLSQNPDANLKISKSDLEVVDNIGNLLPLYFRDNSKLGNVTTAAKYARLKGDLAQKIQNLTYVNQFLSKYGKETDTWGRENIEKRATDMARSAYLEVWKF
jgi:Protein of unknown function (DUF1524)